MRKTKLENWIQEVEGLPVLDREALDALQLKKLNETLKRLHDMGKAYPESVKSLKELENLPFTTAKMLAENPGSFLLTSQSEVSRVISGATSGTTGPAKRVFYTDRDTEHTVGFFAAGISEMLSAGEKCLIAFPFSGPFGLGDLIAKAVERLGAIPVKAGFGQSWAELCQTVKETQPETYIGFPVTLLGLCRVYGNSFPIRRALVSGDACPEGVMQALEKALGSRLYPHYGSRECGLGGAVTCPAFDGMHLRENHIIPEIIDGKGNVLPEGEFGELVITTIGLEAMPLIRYRTGDYTRIIPACPCGGLTRRIDRVIRKEGKISMEQLDSIVFSFDGVVDFRAEFKDKLRIELCCVAKINEAELRERIEKLYPCVKIELVCGNFDYSARPMYLGKRFVEG